MSEVDDLKTENERLRRELGAAAAHTERALRGIAEAVARGTDELRRWCGGAITRGTEAEDLLMSERMDEIGRLTARVEEARRELATQDSLVAWVRDALDGADVDDFAMSFPVVREVVEQRIRAERLRAERDAAIARANELAVTLVRVRSCDNAVTRAAIVDAALAVHGESEPSPADLREEDEQ